MVELITLAFSFFIGIIASFVGSMVGGGGLLSIPLLVIAGLPPQVAIATNKFGAVGLNLGSLSRFWSEEKINWKYVPFFAFLSLVGAYIGANTLLLVDEKSLEKIIGIIILALLPLLFIRKEIGVKKYVTSRSKRGIGYVLYFLIMIFGSFFGGGAVTLVLYTLMIFFGFTIIESNATNIIPWLLLSLFSSFIFVIAGLVDYKIAFALFIGMLVGGYLGAHMAIEKGNLWVKFLFAIVVCVSAIKLLF